MKHIEVSDEVYQKLITLATEMTTQDPRGTKMPHMFQVRSRKKVYDWSLNGDEKCWIDRDQGVEIESVDDLIYYLEGREQLHPSREDLTRCWNKWHEDLIWGEDTYSLDDYIETFLPSLTKCSYSWEYEFHNHFLTAKACQEHIDCNKHHYTDPDTYLNHAWRNPEMELLSEFLCSLVGKPLYT